MRQPLKKMLLYNICLKIVRFSRQKTWKKIRALKIRMRQFLKKKLLVVSLSFITCNISSIKAIEDYCVLFDYLFNVSNKASQ